MIRIGFVWLRSFTDMEARKAALTKFYSGPIWKAHGRLAAGTMVDSDNVLLLRPLRPETAFAPSKIKLPPPGTRGPGKGVLVANIVYVERNTPSEFGEFFEKELQPHWEQAGAPVIAQMVSEHSPNTYPSLPVRERENVFVWFALFPDQASIDKQQRALAQSMEWREVAGKLSCLDAPSDRDFTARADGAVATAEKLKMLDEALTTAQPRTR